MNIPYHIAKIIDALTASQVNDSKIQQHFQNEKIDSLIKSAERGMNLSAEYYLAHRDLVITLYDLIPSLPPYDTLMESNALHVYVDTLTQFEFPVYRITLPYLLPNKRERKTALKTAITDAARSAIRSFCEQKHILPFDHATVIFVSSYEGESLNIDNDNKESVLIINGLIGNMICDDRASVCNSIYYSQRISEGARTEIYVVEAKHDIEVYSAIKKKEI